MVLLPMNLPPWFTREIPDASQLGLLRSLKGRNLSTVCQAARCPNISECLSGGEMTFMILGGVCTRHCSFCAVERGSPGVPLPDEPARVARMVQELGLRYAVVTSVTRDDLKDGGAAHFARTIEALHGIGRGIAVEALISDFGGARTAVRRVSASGPSVIGHNIETVPRLYGRVRPEAHYARSLRVLRYVKESAPRILTKSSLMLGMGETREEVLGVMRDLRECGCDILTMGQYLAPTKNHYPVKEFLTPGEFEEYGSQARAIGFPAVMAGPRVRSSFHARELYEESLVCVT